MQSDMQHCRKYYATIMLPNTSSVVSEMVQVFPDRRFPDDSLIEV